MPAIQAGVGWAFILKNDQTVFPQSGARTISGWRQEPGLSGSVLVLAWLYLRELQELPLEPEVAALALVEAEEPGLEVLQQVPEVLQRALEAEEPGVADKPVVDTQVAVSAVVLAVGKHVAAAVGT